MKTFALSNGDLAIGPRGFAMVTGAAKLRQDLGVAMREPVGTDRFHPSWGSALSNYVGGIVSSLSDTLVRSEVARVVSNYITVQQDIRSRDNVAGRPTRFSPGEIVQKINSVDITQSLDTLHIRISLVTLGQEEVILHTQVNP